MLSKIRIMSAELHREIEARAAEEKVPLLTAMLLAAQAFVTEAERRADTTGEPLNLDLAEAFKGLVIEVAEARYSGDKDRVKKAFLLLGKGATVKGRNHWATHDREMGKLASLRSVLGILKTNGISVAPTNGAATVAS